ncbi:MAG: 16S rRNA (guanine(966)-N(2))-methyltransferase RsmD [Acidobacteriota bacterium]
MRVIAGSLKGRRLRTLEGLKVRPTSDRLRETLFNVLSPRIEEARFLDLCAGSGAVGIEAVSRGAREVVFVESSRRAASLIDENLAHCGITDGVRLVYRDVIAGIRFLISKDMRFDVIYFDPPYESRLYSPVLNLISSSRTLAEDGVVVAEHRGSPLEANYGDLRPYREIAQGDSRLTFYSYESVREDASVETPDPQFLPPEPD